MTPIDHLYGWSSLGEDCIEISARHSEVGLPFARVLRPDVSAYRPGPYFGFSIFLDLPSLSRQLPITPGPLEIEFVGDGRTVAACTLQISEQALANVDAIRRNKAEKDGFIARHADRPLDRLEGCQAPSALPADWTISPRLADHVTAVSSHPYGGVVIDFISSLSGDKFVLDAGAGLRKTPYDNVINLDIYDYPSTDILGVGDDLPFNDNSFDGALSIAVLEHVDDPFRCARELIRVVKPGGRILAIIPFLQAEHGYPSHYFNATRFGMRRLFSQGTTVEKHFLEISNHPIFTLNQILGTYAAGLPEPQRTRFLNTPVRQFVETPPTSLYVDRHEFVTDIAEEKQWELAWGTTAIFVKD
ncbi:MAG TPA: class I SAM-dependent methyltransferase [Stellaceae bacterium]|jgi:SAM-dependent methyltransferase|nr:class I SAM-dependent methyltransferase [Stellaceae bacterium]